MATQTVDSVDYARVLLLLQVAEQVAGYPALKSIGDATMLELTVVADNAQKIVAKAAADKKAAEDKAAAEQAAKDKAEADKVAKEEKARADMQAKAAAPPPPVAAMQKPLGGPGLTGGA
jgi:membrane protein involved in colicin uptake